MSPSKAEIVHRATRWLPIAAIFALAPKCLLCFAAYSGVAAALGTTLGGLEICGAATGRPGNSIAWFTMLVAVVGLVFARRYTKQKRGRDHRAVVHEEADDQKSTPKVPTITRGSTVAMRTT
jgi:hypothetical protein